MTDDFTSRIEDLEAQVERLDRELAQVRQRLDAPQPAPSTAPQPLPPPPADWQQPLPPPPADWQRPTSVAPPPRRHPIIPERKPDREPLVIESETALKWGGVGLVVLAVGFAVSTAISRGWIGPELQLAGAVAVSVALIVVGLRLLPTRPAWTHALCSGGVAALFTTVASNLFLDQLNDDVAFTCAVIIGLGGFVLSRLVPSEWVAATTLLGGIVSWLVIGDGEPPFVASWAWLIVVVAVGLFLALDQRWFPLRLLAHVVGLYAVAGLASAAETSLEQYLALTGMVLVALSLARLPSIGDLTTAWQRVEVQLVLGVAPWVLGVITLAYELEGDTAIGATAIAAAVAVALVAIALFTWSKPAHFVSMLISASIGLSIGLAFLLSTTAAFVAIAVQGAGLVVLAGLLDNNMRVLINAAVLSAISAVYVTGTMIEAWDLDAPVGDDIGHLVIIAALAVTGWLTRHLQLRQITGAVVLALVLVWLGSVLVHLPQGQAVVSVSWAVVGTVVLVTGALRKMPEVGAAGLTVLAATVAKLLVVDLREVDTLWRAGLFFVVGVAILRLGFLLPQLTGATHDDAGDRADDSEPQPID